MHLVADVAGVREVIAMLLVDDIRKRLLTQRRDLFRQVAQTEEELL